MSYFSLDLSGGLTSRQTDILRAVSGLKNWLERQTPVWSSVWPLLRCCSRGAFIKWRNKVSFPLFINGTKMLSNSKKHTGLEPFPLTTALPLYLLIVLVHRSVRWKPLMRFFTWGRPSLIKTLSVMLTDMKVFFLFFFYSLYICYPTAAKHLWMCTCTWSFPITLKDYSALLWHGSSDRQPSQQSTRKYLQMKTISTSSPAHSTRIYEQSRCGWSKFPFWPLAFTLSL